MLDPFRPLIRELAIEKDLTSVRIQEEIQDLGYKGGYTILRDYVRRIRPKPLGRRPHLRFETGPGVQGQVDLSPYTVEINDVPTDVVCFSFILGFSRWQYIRFFFHADAHTVCHSHALAFEDAGGIPREILYDRMKQVFIEVHRTEIIYHALFEKMMHHYGFEAIPLEPGYKEGKGKVENPFKYVEGNFLAGRRFHSLEDLNAQAFLWLRDKARVRIHRTTHERPIDRLQVERPSMIRLPTARFNAAQVELRLVGADFCVAWETNRYSVPPRFVGHQAWLHVLEGRIEVFINGEVVVEHAVRDTEHQRYMLPEHETEFRLRNRRGKVLEREFEELGRAAKPFADGLRDVRPGSAAYHKQKILELVDRVGRSRVVAALKQATQYGAFNHKSVARIVAAKPSPTRTTPSSAKALLPKNVPQYLRGVGPHQRSIDHYRLTKDKEDGDGK